MRSFNSGREWWCALFPSAKAEPLWFGVQSQASKEFVTGRDILIGLLTSGKDSSRYLDESLFLSHPKLRPVLSTRFWQHLHTHLLLSKKCSPKCITHCPAGSIKETGEDYCEKWTMLWDYLSHSYFPDPTAWPGTIINVYVKHTQQNVNYWLRVFPLKGCVRSSSSSNLAF